VAVRWLKVSWALVNFTYSERARSTFFPYRFVVFIRFPFKFKVFNSKRVWIVPWKKKKRAG
jgi:hypothetical protein